MRVRHSPTKVVNRSDENLSESESPPEKEGVGGNVSLDLSVKLHFLKHQTPWSKAVLFVLSIVLLILLLWILIKIGRVDLVDEVLHVLASF